MFTEHTRCSRVPGTQRRTAKGELPGRLMSCAAAPCRPAPRRPGSRAPPPWVGSPGPQRPAHSCEILARARRRRWHGQRWGLGSGGVSRGAGERPSAPRGCRGVAGAAQGRARGTPHGAGWVHKGRGRRFTAATRCAMRPHRKGGQTTASDATFSHHLPIYRHLRHFACATSKPCSNSMEILDFGGMDSSEGSAGPGCRTQPGGRVPVRSTLYTGISMR